MIKPILTKTSITDGTEVRMFRNLKSYTNSVQMRLPNAEGKNRWITVGYIDEIRLDDAQFIVHEKTRQKVVAEGKKYVHAFSTCTALMVYINTTITGRAARSSIG